uniref:JmjC domain-containing protein n=1 Tax=Meloidogyne floridensis TaxID=298350 RepID=A0A915PB71_9BILA
MDFYSQTNFNPNFDTTTLLPHTSSSSLTCNTTDLDKEANNPVSSNALSSSGSSNQNVCAHCGFEIYEPIFSKDKASTLITNLPHLPLHDASLMNQKDGNFKLFRSHDEDTSEWIFCDICRKWFHANCVDIQQYEMPLIDKYHCPSCRFEHGDSIMKVKRLFHRYVFDNESQRTLPIQIGTEAWTHNFKNEYRKIPEVTREMIDLYEDGRQLMQNFNFLSKWSKPIKVKNCKGLGLRMPDDPYFDILDVIKLLGGHVLVDTIDVFAQQTYTMSLDRFYGLWKKRIRDRLYNILSLEFSGTKLSDIVRSPSIVRELSWVRRFWPRENQSELHQEISFDDIYTFDENPTWQKHFGRATEADHQHESSRPYVENFCLLGMRGSYTDFHIDFGGSSVWYHVFKGSKIFFIAPPTPENFQAFLNWQNDKERSEKFFGDLLPNGGKIYRLEVGERETLLLPSGWIHSVYTPEDSIVFGGNFLHSLNVDLQLRVYDMELAVETDERFKFPFFELCNIYAAKSFAESIKDCTECGQLADQFQIYVATLLLEKCSKWIQEADKFSIFKGTLKQLEKQLERQTNLQRRIKAHNLTINSTSMPAISPSFQCSPLRQPELEIQDLDSSWDQDDLDDCEQEDDLIEPIADDSDNNSDFAHFKITFISVFSIKRMEAGSEHICQKPSTSSNNVTGLVDAVSDIDPEGHIRLKIKLPCWHQNPDNEKKQVNNNNVIADEDETDIGAMFSGRSIHGRQIRPTSRISTLGGITM